MKAKIHEEEYLLAAEIATAIEFTACLHLGPGNRHTTRGLPNYDAAVAAGEELNKLSRFGRKAVIYAITAKGHTIDCTPLRVRLAGEIKA